MSGEKLTLYTPSGLGDTLWSFFYVISNTDKDVILRPWRRSANISTGFFDEINNVETVDPFRSPFKSFEEYRKHALLKKNNSYVNFDNLNGVKELFLDINEHLNTGNRIETFLPKLKCNLNIPWKFDVNKKVDTGDCILLSTAGIPQNSGNGVSHYEFNKWTPESWKPVIDNIKSTYPNKRLIWVGNKFDSSIFEVINKSKFDDLWIEQKAEELIPKMKNCYKFIAYQSGLAVVSIYEYVPTYMFYFNRLVPLYYSWCPKSSIENDKIYRPVLFDKFEMNNLIEWLDKKD